MTFIKRNVKDNAEAQIKVPLSSTATSLLVHSGQASFLPDAPCVLTLNKRKNNSIIKYEKVKVSNREGDTLTIERGFGDTTPQEFSIDDYVSCFVTEDVIQDLQDRVQESAIDENVVHKSGDETIDGVKTFSSLPKAPSTSGTSDVATEESVNEKIKDAGNISYLSAKRELGEDFPDIVETSTKETKGLSAGFGLRDKTYLHERIFTIEKIGNPSELVVKKGTLENTTHHEIGSQGRTMELDNVIGKITIGTKLNGGASSARYTKIIDRNTNEVIKQRDDIGETYEYTFNEPRNIKIVLTHHSYYISFIHYNTFDGLDYSLGIGENDEGQSGDIYLFSAETSDADNYYSIREKYIHLKPTAYFIGAGEQYTEVPADSEEKVGKNGDKTSLILKIDKPKDFIDFDVTSVGTPTSPLLWKSTFKDSFYENTDSTSTSVKNNQVILLKKVEYVGGPIKVEAKCSSYGLSSKIIIYVDGTQKVRQSLGTGYSTFNINVPYASVVEIKATTDSYRNEYVWYKLWCKELDDSIEWNSLEGGKNIIESEGSLICFKTTDQSENNYWSLSKSNENYLSGRYIKGYKQGCAYQTNPDIQSRRRVDGVLMSAGERGEHKFGIELGYLELPTDYNFVGPVYADKQERLTTTYTDSYIGMGLGNIIKLRDIPYIDGDIENTATTGDVALGNAVGYMKIQGNDGKTYKIPVYGE